LDNVLQTGTKSGYVFTLTSAGNAPASTFDLNGDPRVPGSTGQRHFYTDASGVIRYNTTASAVSSDSPVR
jgi:hypothetical protein